LASGEDIFWSPQQGVLDSDATMQNHLHINVGLPSSALFAYSHKGLLSWINLGKHVTKAVLGHGMGMESESDLCLSVCYEAYLSML